MRVLGIDPGIARTGWGIVEKEKNNATAIEYGCFETLSTAMLAERLKDIHQFITMLLKTHIPDVLSIEDLFFNTNAKTALIVGQARGVVLLAAAQTKIPVISYTPLQIKVAVTGYGRAEKAQVGQMVKTLLKLQTVPKPDDTTDALAIAITHAFSSSFAK